MILYYISLNTKQVLSHTFSHTHIDLHTGKYIQVYTQIRDMRNIKETY